MTAVWNALTSILNGLVFVLIGLQMHYVVIGIKGFGMARLILFGALFSALVIVLRLLWIFPGRNLLTSSANFSGQTQREAVHVTDFRRGLDGNAGRDRVGCGRSPCLRYLRTEVLSAAKHHHFSHLQRDSGDSGAAGVDSACHHPCVGTGREGHTTEEDDARRMMLQAALEHLRRRREESEADLRKSMTTLPAIISTSLRHWAETATKKRPKYTYNSWKSPVMF